MPSAAGNNSTQRMTREQYREVYLRSDHWQQTRLAALEHAEHRCQVCNSAAQLDVHHRTYERVGAERPADLTVLCRSCHELFHSSGRKVAKTRSSASKSTAPTTKRYADIATTRLWSALTPEDQEVLIARCLRVLDEAGNPMKPKAIGVKVGARANVVGQALCVLRDRELAARMKGGAWFHTKWTRSTEQRRAVRAAKPAKTKTVPPEAHHLAPALRNRFARIEAPAAYNPRKAAEAAMEARQVEERRRRKAEREAQAKADFEAGRDQDARPWDKHERRAQQARRERKAA